MGEQCLRCHPGKEIEIVYGHHGHDRNSHYKACVIIQICKISELGIYRHGISYHQEQNECYYMLYY